MDWVSIKFNEIIIEECYLRKNKVALQILLRSDYVYNFNYCNGYEIIFISCNLL